MNDAWLALIPVGIVAALWIAELAIKHWPKKWDQQAEIARVRRMLVALMPSDAVQYHYYSTRLGFSPDKESLEQIEAAIYDYDRKNNFNEPEVSAAP